MIRLTMRQFHRINPPIPLGFRFGRRIPLILSYLQIAITGTSTAFSPSFSSYCVFRFMAGMTFSGIVLNSFSLSEYWLIRGIIMTHTTMPTMGYVTGVCGQLQVVIDWWTCCRFPPVHTWCDRVYAYCMLLVGDMPSIWVPVWIYSPFRKLLLPEYAPLCQSAFAANAYNIFFCCFSPSSGMDTRQRPDSGRCLLGIFCYFWTDNPGRGCIQDQELALASTGCLSAFLHCLFMLLVSDNSSTVIIVLQKINMA